MPRRTSYLQPRLKGRRFEHHTLPLEVLQDFSALRYLIVEVAKHLYLRNNPDRKRSPKNFTKNLSLHLTHIYDGSAKPQIDLIAENYDLLGENEDYMLSARDYVINAIYAANCNDNIHSYLPSTMLTHFNRIGRSLRSEEFVEFPIQATQKTAYLDEDTRFKLVLASKAQEVSKDATLRGRITGFETDNEVFWIKLASSTKKIRANLDEFYKDLIYDQAKDNGYDVRIEGLAIYDKNNKIDRIERIYYMTTLEYNDPGLRIEYLKTLRNGWMDGRATAPSLHGLDWLIGFFDCTYPDDIQFPSLYPTPKGLIESEWDFDNHEPTLEIDIDNKTAIWHDLEMSNMEEEHEELNMEDEEHLEYLFKKLRQISAE